MNSDAGEASGQVGASPPAAAWSPEHRAFLQRLDHDLRTPLGTMAAALALLRDEPPGTPAHGDAVAVLERQIARLHSLTESLRDFSRQVGP
ncbi:histidine kinase dimerization/phospho-acceptor domain-containing protein [Variovorax sp. ZT4R33]|uniref:histidine kinase dimerization/phospho-acceptor domain-containing protein n=1 Tax=Variovorax sp. ZT4R33 TaxID=3443743 RepID=UPI003F4572FC